MIYSPVSVPRFCAVRYIAVCTFCAVHYLIISCFSLLISNYSTNVLKYSFYVFFVLYICILFSVFCVSVLFCVFFLLLYIAVTYFCTSLPTTATGWKSDSVIKYRNISIRIFYPHILYPGTKSLRSSASRIGIPFFSSSQNRRLDTRTISPVKRKRRPDVKFVPKRGISAVASYRTVLRARAHTHTLRLKPPRQRRRLSNSTLLTASTVIQPHVKQEQHDAPCNVILIYQIHLAQRYTANYSTSSSCNYTTFILQILLLV